MKLRHIALIGSLFPFLLAIVLFFGVLISYKSQDNLTNLLQLSVLNFFRIKFIFDSIRWTINIK